MPEEEKNANEEQAPEGEQPEEVAAEQPEEPAAEEAPTEEASADEEPAAEAEEPEAAAEKAPAEEAGEEAEPEKLGPKQRRKLERSRHAGEAMPTRSPEERATERGERRRLRGESRRRWRERSRERGKAAPAAEPLAPVERSRAQPRVRQGVVVSDKADKTITVRIDMQRPHRTYGKIVRTSSTLHVHDEQNEAHTGDTVRVVESRPLSATKRWRLVEVLERAR
jgi:small subunit ribosomal protein S17